MANVDTSVQSSARPGLPFLAAYSLCRREWLRFFRQRNRVVGALGQPVVFWLLFSAGLGPSFRLGESTAGPSYAEYFFPGTIALVVLFTAIFTTISIIEDRREGFLQAVLVAPIPRWSMVAGKVLGGAAIAVVQGLLFLMLGLTLGLSWSGLSLVLVVAFLTLLAVGLTGLGFVIAWRMESTQGFHAVMSLFLMPMWLLSGAFFPAERGWLAVVLAVNPLTYGVAGLRQLLYLDISGSAALPAGLPALWVCWFVTGGFAAAMFAASCAIAGTRTTGDLL